jgi:magnesium chelatase subunit I
MPGRLFEEVPLTRNRLSIAARADRPGNRAQFQSGSQEDAGLAEVLPFPFLGLVGQMEMKLALLIAVINPLVSGVLLVGPRGTGKTTIVRSLVEPAAHRQAQRLLLRLPARRYRNGGMDAVCPDCARKYGEGQPLTRIDRGPAGGAAA